MRKTLPALCFISLVTLKVPANDFAPTLKILPLGSTLSKVTIPQFDENKKRAGYLKADLMRILSDGADLKSRQVACELVELRVFSPNGAEHLAVDAKKAIYLLTPGLLAVNEQIDARGERFTFRGTGGVFHLASRRGFIHGPLQCKILPQTKPQVQLMNPRLFLLATLATSLATAQERPLPLTAAELVILEIARSSMEHEISKKSQQTAAMAQEHATRAQSADRLLQDFAQLANDEGITRLVQNKDIAPPEKDPEAIVDPSIEIKCEGGAFFDGEENVLVFLKNIEVSEYRFNLKAGKDLKLFFSSQNEDKEKAKPQADGVDEDDMPKIEIGDIALLSASGGVRVTGKDQKGNPFFVRAELATYDERSKNLILKGGSPYYRGSPNGTHLVELEASQADSAVRINLADQKAPRLDLIGEGWTIPVKKR